MPTLTVKLTHRFAALQTGDDLDGLPVTYSNDAGPWATVEVPEGVDEHDVLQQLQAQGLIEAGHPLQDGWHPLWIEPDPIQALALTALYVVGDTYPLMGITEAVMARGRYGAGIKAGHVDTWVDALHPWFAQTAIQAGGPGRDTQSHGTHTAATLVGGEGILRQAALITYNGLPNGRGTEQGIAQGIDWVVDQGADFVSLSLGGGGVSALIGQSVNRARQRGVPVFAAAGNSGGAATSPGSPAREASWQVLACDRDRHAASFTDGRAWTTPNRVYAIGVDVVSAFPNGQQGAASGTSMATPQIAAASGLLKAGGVTALWED